MPVKRPRSPCSSPPRDRPTGPGAFQASEPAAIPDPRDKQNINNSVRPSEKSHTLGEIFGYQELFLRILSFLSPTELAIIQGVDRYWSRMALDQQLWKRLYLARYSHPHHSRLVYKNTESGSSTPKKLRPIARLPSRAFPPPSPVRSPSASSLSGLSSSPKDVRTQEKGKGVALPLQYREDAEEIGYGVRNDGVDWKTMLRLGTNWANGNASSQGTIRLPPSPSPSHHSLEADLEVNSPSGSTNTRPPYSEQHIALFPSFIFTSNPTSPLVHVHHSLSESAPPLGIIPPPPGWSSPTRPDNVTAICGDQSALVEDQPNGDTAKQDLPARLGVFYQSGGFVVLRVRIDASRLHWVRESVHPPSSRPRSIRRRSTAFTPVQGDPVVLATMHFPVLITCTLAFHLSVYTLTSSLGNITRPKHLSTMHSDVSFHPAALSLFPAEQSESLETRNGSFRAALTYCSPVYPASWTIAVQEFGVDLYSVSTNEVWRGECYNVGTGEDADEADEIWPRKIRPIVGVKGSRAVGVGTDGRWCVLAGEDNQIQVYSLPTPAASPLPLKMEPILHSQTLLAHSAAVTSISLNAGRCVSGGRDGRILVWELDDEDEAEEHVYGEARTGRTIGYVEVRQGGRRWKGPSGPEPDMSDVSFNNDPHDDDWVLPHPASISSAARSLFLPRPPDLVYDRPPAIRQLAFDEEKIVGLVRTAEIDERSSGSGESLPTGAVECLKVWNFNG